MPVNYDEILTLKIGDHTVAKNLQHAIESGALLQNEDGTFILPPYNLSTKPALFFNMQTPLNCKYLKGFLFNFAYAQSAVPFGCKQCFKVIVLPNTLRQLMALKSIHEKIECTSKCGVEVNRAETPKLYSSYFYCTGLDHAREIYKIVRIAVNSHPTLGFEVPVQIKRGCTEYEIHCGPSNKYDFKNELPELENYLKNRFAPPPKIKRNKKLEKQATIVNWIKTAYRIGDDTYLDFTGGKQLYPKSVIYDPEPDKN